MATHPAAIDALVTRKIRRDVMKCSEATATFDTLLGRFSLSRANLQWVVVPPASTTSALNAASVSNRNLFDVQTSGKNQILAVVKYPGKHTCTVCKLNGTVVASQNGIGPVTHLFTENLVPGSYVVAFSGKGGQKEQRTIHLFRK
jgi:hypothetical protein